MRTPGRPTSTSSAAASVLLVVSVASFLSVEKTNAFVVPSSSLLVYNNNSLRPQESRLYSVWNIYNGDDDNEVDVPSPTREESQQEYDDQRNGYYYSFHEESDIRRNNDDKMRAVGMATALAAGTVMAWHGGVSAAGAVNTMMEKVPTATTTASINVWQQPPYSFDNNNQRQGPAVSLPYLEEQIRAAEEALYTQQPSMMMADTAATVAPSAPKPAAAAPAATAAAPKPAASTAAAPATAAATAAKPAATTAETPAAPKPAATSTAAAPAAPKPPAATVAATTTPAKPAAPKPATAAKSSPSLYRYTKQHWPEWVKASKMAYRTAEPVVMQISKDVTYQLDKNILPEVRKVEHRILGDPVANVVDRAAATVVKAGTVAVGTAGKAVPVVFEAGKQVVQATPKVIQAGKQVYTTLDKQVIPELKKDYKLAKKVVEEKTPQVIRAGKQVYQTGRQLYYAVEEDVLPKVMAAEKKLAPKINALEHRILGDEAADVVDKAVGLTIRSGKTAAMVISKNAPAVFSAAQKTVNGAYQTGKFVVKGGQQVYHFGEEYIPKAYRTTKTVVLAADRTGGQLANVIDKEAPKVLAAVKKEIPKIRETGGRVQRAIEPAVVQLAESGKAITTDVVTLVEKQIEGNEEAASVVAVGAAATAIVTAATSEDSFLVDTYGRSGTSISGSSGGFPSLFSRSRGGYTELSRRRF